MLLNFNYNFKAFGKKLLNSRNYLLLKAMSNTQHVDISGKIYFCLIENKYSMRATYS